MMSESGQRINEGLRKEIKSFVPSTMKMFETILQGEYKGKAYSNTEELVDKFGSRFDGTQELEDSIKFMMEKMRGIGLSNVHGEPVMIPHWVRDYEHAEMTLPRKKKISILGLGPSVGTPIGGIQAEIIIVKSFDELKQRSKEVKGKIVLFNPPWSDYGALSPYRRDGCFRAAEFGAVASLTRSVTPLSLYTLHTGSVRPTLDAEMNVDTATPIPAACITVEDAELLQRMVDKGEKVFLNLVMNDYLLPSVESCNTIGEIPGTSKADELVIISAHLDSWDVGQGAMDDGGGVGIIMAAVEVLKKHFPQMKRTLRLILWTGEEMGLLGAKRYVKDHKEELSKISVACECDADTFTPLGLGFSGSMEAASIMREIGQEILSPLNATDFETFDFISSDVDEFIRQGVPALNVVTDRIKIFWYHHTEADTMNVLNSNEMDNCAAAWAGVLYVLCNMSEQLPR